MTPQILNDGHLYCRYTTYCIVDRKNKFCGPSRVAEMHYSTIGFKIVSRQKSAYQPKVLPIRNDTYFKFTILNLFGDIVLHLENSKYCKTEKRRTNKCSQNTVHL